MADEILPPLETEDKMLSGLCYPFWMALPFFILASSKRQDPFLLFHALQGLAVGVVSTVGGTLGLLFLWVIFSSLPSTYTMTSSLIGVFLVMGTLAVGGMAFLLSIFLGWQASTGRFLRLPALGDWCEAKMAQILDLSSAQLLQMARDRELAPDEKVVVLAPVSTPEQLQADMDRWAQVASQNTWWGSNQESKAPEPPVDRPVAPPSRLPTQAAASEVKPWRPNPTPQHPTPTPPRRVESEVKPWRPASAESAPKAKPVSFPSVSRTKEEPQEPKKWWKPKDP